MRLTLSKELEAETARAAHSAMLPPPRGGARPSAPPSSGLTTGVRRLLVGLHSSHALMADKLALSSRDGPPVSSSDGRVVGAPPGSLLAPKTMLLEEDRAGRPPPGALMLKPQGNAGATLDGFVLSPSLALVFELQTEVPAQSLLSRYFPSSRYFPVPSLAPPPPLSLITSPHPPLALTLTRPKLLPRPHPPSP